MELGLSLGDSSRPFVGFMEKPRSSEPSSTNQLGLGFTTTSTTLSIGPIITTRQRNQQQQQENEEKVEAKPKDIINNNKSNNNPPLHQLDLLPQLSLPWHPSQNGRVAGGFGVSSKGLDVNVLPLTTVAAAGAEDETEEGAALSSSPNSAASSFQTDLCIFGGGGGSHSGGSGVNYYNHSGKRDHSDGEAYDHHHRRDSSRASDEDENCGGDGDGDGCTRKKLRLSKEQSAFLEESFKEHNTLNPKQKLALAKQLNLRPRQVEVWFQNRRARTKLKQTEVDCEYLKRCCETLTEENRRLHKELQELRALKTSNPSYMQLPATTLTMCPSCERVATNPSNNSASPTPNNNSNNNFNGNNNSCDSNSKAIGFPLGKHRNPFNHTTHQEQQKHHPH
ncbi:hypothetical protein PIB30_051881 [Stylosanthes scabra]|uniref:Homeobox domain-containing protein n=1 Tax=Stylosanthes scabra TaxID=79078 RepID=A0ABU6UGW9_9FABA|nr:hypothetical protein [Stylosanthes scabra]